MTTIRTEYSNGMMNYNVEQSLDIPLADRQKELIEAIRQAEYELMNLRAIIHEQPQEVMVEYSKHNKE